MYLKPQINKLFPSIAHLAVHLSPQPTPTANCHVLASNSQIEFRHTPQLRKTCPQKGSKCFILVSHRDWWSASDGQHNMEGSRVDRALNQKIPSVDILNKAIPHLPNKCCIRSSGLDLCHGLLRGLPECILYSASELSSFTKQRSNGITPLLTYHPQATSASSISLAKLLTTQAPHHSSHLEKMVWKTKNVSFPLLRLVWMSPLLKPSLRSPENVRQLKAVTGFCRGSLLSMSRWQASALPGGQPGGECTSKARIKCSLHNWSWPSFLNKHPK